MAKATLTLHLTHEETARTGFDREVAAFITRLRQVGYQTFAQDDDWEAPPRPVVVEETVCPVCLTEREGQAIPASMAQAILRTCERHTIPEPVATVATPETEGKPPMAPEPEKRSRFRKGK